MTPVRMSVREDCLIEIERFTNGRRTAGPYRYAEEQIDSAMGVVRLWLDKEMATAKSERFVPQADREAARIYKQYIKKGKP